MAGRMQGLRRKRHRYTHGEPIRRPGLAPFASVFLIAATLVLSTYGPHTHALIVALPMPYPENYMEPLTPAYDRIVIDVDGRVLINSTPVTDRELHDALLVRQDGANQASLVFEPDAMVPYPRVLQVLEIFRATGSLETCFLFGNVARFAAYDRPEAFADLVPAQPRTCFVPPPAPYMPTYR